MSRKIVVTGGTGFIGSNLCNHLLSLGDEVLAFDNLAYSDRSNIDPNVEFIEGDIRDEKILASAFRGADVIYHLAARGSVPKSLANPDKTNDINVLGTLNVLKAAVAAEVPRLVFSSSSSVYGNSTHESKSESHCCAPISPYGVSKLAGESYCEAWRSSYDLETTSFRFFNVFGRFQKPDGPYAAVVPKFVNNFIANKPLPIFGDGTQTRDFTYVDDVVGILERFISENFSSDSPINLAFGNPVSVGAIADAITGGNGEKQLNPIRLGDIQHSKADPALLRSYFPNFVPTPLPIAISQTIDSFKHLS